MWIAPAFLAPLVACGHQSCLGRQDVNYSALRSHSTPGSDLGGSLKEKIQTYNMIVAQYLAVFTYHIETVC